MQSRSNAPSSICWTVTDLEILSSDRRNRYEIIAGELFVTRAPRWQHQMTCGKIATALNNWIMDSGFGQVAVGPGLVFSETDNVIPDVVWATDETLAHALDQSDHLTAAPELVVEVLSPGIDNQRRDQETKRKLYSVCGVQEYWIFDCESRWIEIYRRESSALVLAITLFSNDQLTSPLLPGFMHQVGAFFG